MEKQFIIVGAGGIAAHTLVALALQLKHAPFTSHLIIVDGDTFEDKNVMRQALAVSNSGGNKAMVMAGHLKTVLMDESRVSVTGIPMYISEVEIPEVEGVIDAIWCMVDNHAARRSAVCIADRKQCPLISSANEASSGEAWLYLPDFKESSVDPFTRYPEMLTSDEGNPLTRAHCTDEEAVQGAPQLPAANMLAGALGLMIFNAMFFTQLDPMLFPAEVRFGVAGVSMQTVGDLFYGESVLWRSNLLGKLIGDITPGPAPEDKVVRNMKEVAA
jgi:molybdopterin/thiamine biosynthesis adenylyltransferase